jgi:hypothetical protein
MIRGMIVKQRFRVLRSDHCDKAKVLFTSAPWHHYKVAMRIFGGHCNDALTHYCEGQFLMVCLLPVKCFSQECSLGLPCFVEYEPQLADCTHSTTIYACPCCGRGIISTRSLPIAVLLLHLLCRSVVRTVSHLEIVRSCKRLLKTIISTIGFLCLSMAASFWHGLQCCCKVQRALSTTT